MTQLSSLIDRNQLVELTRRLIQTPSFSEKEGEAAHLLAGWMRRLGFDRVKIDEKSNVIGHVNPGASPTVMFNGHIDHAEIGDMSVPFSAKIIPQKRYGTGGPAIYGRGACDMKGAVAAMVHAAAALGQAGGPPTGSAVVTAVALEEQGEGEGTRFVLDQGLHADMAVCGEATGLRVNVGHRGKYNVEVTVMGESSHSCNPAAGINAVDHMHHFLAALHSDYRPPSHPVLGQCTWTVVDISAEPGWKTPTIPHRCTAVIDRRTLPGETKEDIIDQLSRIAESVRKQHPRFCARMRILTQTSPMLIDTDCQAVRTVQRARAKVMGERTPPGAWRFGTDAPYINERGIPCVGFGPGDETYAHTSDDHLAIADLYSAAAVYAQILQDVCL